MVLWFRSGGTQDPLPALGGTTLAQTGPQYSIEPSTSLGRASENCSSLLASPVVPIEMCWRVSLHPDKELVVGMLADLVGEVGPTAERPLVVHSDGGAVYMTGEWRDACESGHVTRSMSRKARSPDNARCEGSSARSRATSSTTATGRACPSRSSGRRSTGTSSGTVARSSRSR
ncbi:MAG: DDE-type integrase/transposase/recombinase [Atopobiaceae bacterium]|nr:DDE-type integrase/transposase/recombinase [Atopobiaceae bacterium]